MISTRRKTENEVILENVLAEEKREKEGAELLAEAAAEPTLDIYLDRSPKLGAPIDYPAMVALLHRKREMFITAEAKKKSGEKVEEKKDGDED